ncbi:hypothetical protein [Actinophytocola sp.]|uniref:hypothetical protein n=1 Tax=Actinophytocola sp. TaxID=1872138 RepID=UPI002D802600|nr:hypothetical protein [Actinophytocola sp.]HET9141392.1 hypothetical protein [Actinophytocola sp.]
MNRTTPEVQDEVLDLSRQPDEREASTRGLVPPVAGPPQDHVRSVALQLLLIFEVCLFSVLILATMIAWLRPEALQDMIGFFGTVVATMGTLLGGVVAFYFTQR